MPDTPMHAPVRDWWPLDLDDRLLEALSAFIAELEAAAPQLDAAAAADAEHRLRHAMHCEVDEIIEGAALSHYCHLLNGWGDARIAGGRLSDGLAFFARRSSTGVHVRQMHRDGDFHPWQTIAYALMAGADVERELPELAVTLAQLYASSTALATHEGEELGHLLFALAWLPAAAELEFEFGGRSCDVTALMRAAIEAHHDGHFRVCCKTHLCEGICAAAAVIPALAPWREQAQALLDGHLDMMLLFTLGARERAAAQLDGRALDEGSLARAITRALARTETFEDHLFFAGHQLELACFAAHFGYEVGSVHRRAMTLLANLTNTMLPHYLGPFTAQRRRCCFVEHFLFHGHYRRAITLMPAMLAADGRPGFLDRASLAAFTVDFDAACEPPRPVTPAQPDAWTLAPATLVRPRFAELIAAVTEQLPAAFELRGNRAHYRHVKPRHWPKSLHYELLDLGSDAGYFGLELHLEDDAVTPLIPVFAAQRAGFAALHRPELVEWVPSWGPGARLRAFVPEHAPARESAALLMALIEHSYAAVDEALASLRASQGPVGLVSPAVFQRRDVERGRG